MYRWLSSKVPAYVIVGGLFKVVLNYSKNTRNDYLLLQSEARRNNGSDDLTDVGTRTYHITGRYLF